MAKANGGGQSGNFGGATKKAVHVKWAGKTIALGTFPAAEADEKCARAKALTRAWRSTMRPKPSRDWVMTELERLGVRVVSGRLGRKAGDEEDAEKKAAGKASGRNGPADFLTAEINRAMPPVDRNNSLGWSTNADLDSLMQRRSSSLGLSLMNDNDKRRSSLGSLGPALGLDGGDPAMPPHRPFVGGGAAAAYEAARADHYAQQQQRRASSLGLGIGGGNLGGPAGGMQMGMSVNPNQHYEMLKLHHMNLLNEIQETTLMMNLYQQQQIQQQQQQLQQQAGVDAQTGADQMTLLQQQAGVPGPGLDQLYGGSGGLSHRGSLGLGTSSGNSIAGPSGIAGASASSIQEEILKGRQEQAALEERLKELRENIARQQKEASELESTKPAKAAAASKKAPTTNSLESSNESKRKNDCRSPGDNQSKEKEAKKAKTSASPSPPPPKKEN